MFLKCELILNTQLRKKVKAFGKRQDEVKVQFRGPSKAILFSELGQVEIVLPCKIHTQCASKGQERIANGCLHL